MKNNQFALLGDRRFAPLFVTQFLGALHDNLFKYAMVVLLTNGILSSLGYQKELLVTVAAGLFILPFVLFSGFGGQLADKYPKERIIRTIKAVEIFIACVGGLALITSSTYLSFAALFLLGSQSAFFGPSKYSILPQHLQDKELIGGNALLNTGTFLAILVGTIAGVVLIGFDGGAYVVGGSMLICAVVGYMSSRYIPEAAPHSPDVKFRFNIFGELVEIVSFCLSQNKGVRRSILGVAWFYFLGGLFMAQFPNFTNATLHADENVLAFFLVVFSVGVALGGLLNNRLLRGRIEALFVPLAVIGITIFSIDLYFASSAVQPLMASLYGLGEFLSVPAHWRVVVDVAMIALCGGLFVVPLNAIIQHDTAAEIRARVMAGSAIMNAIFVIVASVVSGYLITQGWSIQKIFFAAAIANAFVAVYVSALLPAHLFKSMLQVIFKLLYNVEVKGLENFERAGDRVVVVGNHVSFLDAPLLAAFLPGKPTFAVNSFVAEWFWVKPFLKLVDAFPLDPTNPFSIKSLIEKVKGESKVVIFPEGRLTETGALMKVYNGPGMIADKSDAMILPVRLDGVQHTAFSRLKGKVPFRSFPKITITILEPRKFKLDEGLKGRKRRAAAGRQLYDVMEEMMFLTNDREQTLYQALLKAEYVNGKKAAIAEDIERKPLKFQKLVLGSKVLGRSLAKKTDHAENVGVMLPNSVGAVVTFFALQLYGRVPAMLNFSAGARALSSACETAKLKTVLTSRRFVELGRLESEVEEMSKIVDIVFLEDVKDSLGLWDKLHGLFSSAKRIHSKQDVQPQDPALILFTSGSEGAPKGVVLSHANIMSNIVQLSARVDFNRQDIVFNCLPMFHSFGLTGGTLLPVLSGVKTFLYPSPLHYRIVPEIVYSSNATIMFATDTFLNGYARMADAYDFYRMRYIFAGAEKVKDETRSLYMERFGVRILEGYGATETAPALSVNSPMHVKAGTVGRLLAGIEYKIDKVPGVEIGGRLSVKGPNVMLGYYRPDAPAVLEPPKDGWYDTGDIVDIDADGFIRIVGRAKRFAKIAGEMVSLTSVEVMVNAIYPDADHAVVAIADKRKGEQLVFVTTQDNVDKRALSSYAAENGVSELAVPKATMKIEAIPVLGSGKTDYTSLQKIVESEFGAKSCNMFALMR